MPIDLRDAIAAAQSAPAFFDKKSAPKDTVTGVITFIDMRQTRDPQNGKLQYWEDADGGASDGPKRPMEQLVIILDPGNGEAPGTVYVKWWGEQRKAFAAAIIDAGAEQPEVGGQLTVTYDGLGPEPANKALSAPKLYSYAYLPSHS